MSGFRKEIFAYEKKLYGVEPDYPWVKDPESAVLRHLDTGKWFAVVMPAPKRYLGTGEEGHEDVVTLKCEPLLIDSLIKNEGFYRAYHMNKQQWLSIRLDGTVPLQKILELLDMSFDMTDKKTALNKSSKKEFI